MAKYFKEHDKIFVVPNGAKEIIDNLPADQYILSYDILTGLFLKRANSFSFPEKVFGDIESRVDRVLKTYHYRNCNTGVLLSGDKGSGKTMFAKMLSIRAKELGIPTVIVDSNFTEVGFNKFICDISDKCIVMFDEFEKVFDGDDDQNKVLTLFDGTYQSNKLFVLTANQTHKISDFILNRPGRVYYHFRYAGIDETSIRDFCNYHLNNKEYIDDFVSVSKIIGKFNFDILNALVQECNIHNETPAQIYQMMNVDIDRGVDDFEYVLTEISTGKSKKGSGRYSIYDNNYFYWKIDAENNEDVECCFNYKNMLRFNKESGELIFEKDGFRLDMKRVFVAPMSFLV